MRRSSRYNWLAASYLMIAALGCQSADEPPASAEMAALPAATAPSTEAPTTSPTAKAGDEPSDDVKKDQSPASPSAEASFSPPYPDRQELFEPPKRAQSAVRQNDIEGQSIELKGFVNVDKPRVLLSIDGVITPIAEGDERYGVLVHSIQPPSVVLERGRSRWTATLE
jgi:hypothetical protein